MLQNWWVATIQPPVLSPLDKMLSKDSKGRLYRAC